MWGGTDITKENVGAGLPGTGMASARANDGIDRLVAKAVAAAIFRIPALKFQAVVAARQQQRTMMWNRIMMMENMDNNREEEQKNTSNISSLTHHGAPASVVSFQQK